MDIIISNASQQHIYLQIKEQIKAQIRSGKLAENDALPSLRHLATEIRISVITVQKAYRELEQEGFITSMHGKGYFVVPSNSELFREGLLCEAEEYINKAIEVARMANMTNDEFLNLTKLLMEVKDDE